MVLRVDAVNDAPRAWVTQATTEEDQVITLDVAGAATDVDGDTVTLVEVDNGQHGITLVTDAGQLEYTPEANFHGADQVTYWVSDGRGGADGPDSIADHHCCQRCAGGQSVYD